MILGVHASGKTVAKRHRERDHDLLGDLPGTATSDFVSPTMPVRESRGSGLGTCLRSSDKACRHLPGVIQEESGPHSD